MNKVKATFEFEFDTGGKAQIIFDTATQQIMVNGDAYPWAVRSVLNWADGIRDNAAAARRQPDARQTAPAAGREGR